MSILFECKDLRKNYGKNQALKGLNLQIESGQIVGLLGPKRKWENYTYKAGNGLLTKNGGELYIDGKEVGVETKKVVSYLPERTYLDVHSKVKDVIEFFKDFYSDFEENRAYDMLSKLNINPNDKLKTMSKGTREKVQLILVMSRDASLYILDEPIAGVDPAARDYILRTIITNYNENATVLISTHLITDIENILDEVVFMKEGRLLLQTSVEEIREEKGKSVDAYFREVFAC